jgi:hypothetical protein
MQEEDHEALLITNTAPLLWLLPKVLLQEQVLLRKVLDEPNLKNHS